MVLKFLPIKKTIEVKERTNLLQVAIEHNIYIPKFCSGTGTCGKCKIMITKGNDCCISEEEKRKLTKQEMDSNIRLACCVTIKQDMTILLIEEIEEIKQIEKVSKKSKQSKEVLKELTKTIKQLANTITLGIAFDIGTTSIESELLNLETREVLAHIIKENPQTIYGADVISRITYSIQGEKQTEQMHQLILRACNQIIEQLIETYIEDYITKIEQNNYIEHFENRRIQSKTEWRIQFQQKIKKVIFVGNTTMSHFLAGYCVKGLAKFPFTLSFQEAIQTNAIQFGLTINPTAEVVVLSNIGGHVGSDMLGCILRQTNMQKQDNYLILDVGTNGEMALSNNGKIIVCSTAAGPAFEGASIYKGMRATKGAIHSIQMEESKLQLSIIGNVVPKGICGSGMIELVALLLKKEMIDKTGRLILGSHEKIRKNEDTLFCLLYEDNNINHNIIITQQDIREVQLAKAAIYAGIQVLMQSSYITTEQINNIYIAGAFGNHLNIEKSIEIGLLPNICLERVYCIGNAALEGAKLVLCNEISVKQSDDIAKEIEQVELAQETEFQEIYIQSINF